MTPDDTNAADPSSLAARSSDQLIYDGPSRRLLTLPALIDESFPAAFLNRIERMNETISEFERMLGMAALQLWSELPRDVQEKLFETAVPLDKVIRNRLAIFLHDRHPKTAHPPKPADLA